MGLKILKELPDLSSATNLERLRLSYCESLVEITSSFSHLHKLECLQMSNCKNLQVIPADMNLASLDSVYMDECPRLRKFQIISTHITYLDISQSTGIEGVHASIASCCRLVQVNMQQNEKLKRITHLPTRLYSLDLSFSDMETIPDCMKDLHHLCSLNITGCTRLASLPELPGWMCHLFAEDCESLETVVFSPCNQRSAILDFTNCVILGGEALRAIIQRTKLTGEVVLPGRKVPAEFDHRTKGNSLTIPWDAASNEFAEVMFCVVICHKNQEIKRNHNTSSLPYCINGQGTGVPPILSFQMAKGTSIYIFF